jgi:DNA-directed RNA polymerase subunit N (RpoN/RPB10)
MSIIPVRCFTCGKVLADKYRYYQEELGKRTVLDATMDDATMVNATIEADNVPGEIYEPRRALTITRPTAIREICHNILGLERCCIKTMMTHVDIE